jgi:protein phosphatase
MPSKTHSFAMLSHPGNVRRQNEDACAADVEHGIFVVCDGVGGAASGEIASRLAVESFVTQMVALDEAETPPEASIYRGVEYANRVVQRQARQTAAMRGMATTMVALVFDPESVSDPESVPEPTAGTVWIANVGDSRCYRLRQGKLEQLTNDHSIVEEQVRAGEMTREQAALSPIRNVITRAIGSEAVVEADVQSLPALHGDLYLLATDGLMRDLTDDEIAAILQVTPLPNGGSTETALSALCEQLIDAANQKGGGDNITCLLLNVS